MGNHTHQALHEHALSQHSNKGGRRGKQQVDCPTTNARPRTQFPGFHQLPNTSTEDTKPSVFFVSRQGGVRGQLLDRGVGSGEFCEVRWSANASDG